MENTGKASVSSKRVPFQTPFYYGWLIVVVSALGHFFSLPGQTFTNSIFIESYITDFQMSRTAVSGIYSAATLIAGFMLFGVGKLTDRYGHRKMLTLISLLLGFACFWNSFVTGALTLFIGFFCIRLLGQGSMMMISSTLVSQWFIKKRGRALSFAGLGGLIGAAFFPPFVNGIIESYDWRFAWNVLGIMIIVLFVPIAFYLIRNKPEDVGLLPDSLSPSERKEAPSSPMELSWTLSEAARSRSFWLILVCMAIPAFIYTGFTFQIFSLFGERGVDRTTTAFVLSLMPMVSFVCSLASGFIIERVRVHTMLGFTFLLNIAAPLILIVSNSGGLIVFLFAVMWGAIQGFMNIPLTVIWPNYYGRQHLGSIQSITTAAVVVGSALGPIAFGAAYDTFGSYTLILIISTVVLGLGAALAFLSPPPIKR